MRIRYLLAVISATVLVVATQGRRYRSKRPKCPRTSSYAIGSFSFLRWRPEFSGEGVSILHQRGRSLSVRRLFPVSLIGANPTYVDRLQTPNGPVFYISNSENDGNITSFTVDHPPVIRTAVMPGMLTTHVSIARGKYVISANVFGGTVYAYSADLSTRTGEFIVDENLATGVVEKRQQKPNPHHALPYLYNRLAVPDLGADRTFILDVTEDGRLLLRNTVRHTDGDGPRHAVYHKRSRNLFVVNELSQTVSTLCVKNKEGDDFVVCQRKNLLDAGPHVNGTAAAIRISKNQKFLYVSSRRDSKFTPVEGRIVVFRVNRKTGKIKRKVGEWSSGGVHPRDFNIVEKIRVGGKCRSYVVVANRDSNNVVFIRRYRRTGKLGRIELRQDNIGTPASVLPL